MSYVDGVVMAVENARKEEFIAYSRELEKVFKKYGAIGYADCWGDDVPAGEVTDFIRSVQAKDNETVVFSWIIWPDKEARGAAWDKVMADPRVKELGDMPFDGKRMIFAGFEKVVGG